MQVKMLRSLTPGRKGSTVPVSDSVGVGLIKRGFAVPAEPDDGKKKAKAPVGKSTKTGAQNGGQPGKAKPSPSSLEDRVLPASISSSSKGDAAS